MKNPTLAEVFHGLVLKVIKLATALQVHLELGNLPWALEVAQILTISLEGLVWLITPSEAHYRL